MKEKDICYKETSVSRPFARRRIKEDDMTKTMTRFGLLAVVLAVFCFSDPVQAAKCTTEGDPDHTVLGQDCGTIGMTKLNDDRTAIAACLFNSDMGGSDGPCSWKNMTGKEGEGVGSLCGLAVYGWDQASNKCKAFVKGACQGTDIITAGSYPSSQCTNMWPGNCSNLMSSRGESHPTFSWPVGALPTDFTITCPEGYQPAGMDMSPSLGGTVTCFPPLVGSGANLGETLPGTSPAIVTCVKR